MWTDPSTQYTFTPQVRWIKYQVPADSSIYQFQFQGLSGQVPDSVRYFSGSCTALTKHKALRPGATGALGNTFNFTFQNKGITATTVFLEVYTSDSTFSFITIEAFDVPEMGPCEIIQNGYLNDLQASQPYDPWILWPFTPDPLFVAPFNSNPSAQNGDPGYVGIVLGNRGGPTPDPRVREAIVQPLSNSGVLNTGDIVYGEFWVATKNHPAHPFTPPQVRNNHDCIDMVFEAGPIQSFPLFDAQNRLWPPSVPATNRRISSIQNGVATIQPMSATWQKVSGITTIDKDNVDHVIITNFRSDNFTNPRYVNPPPTNGVKEYSYGIVDDIYITSLPDAGPDATIACGEEVQLGHNSCPNLLYSYSVQWSPTTGLSDPTIPNPVASPSATTTYTLTGTYNGYTYQDQVTVTVNELTFLARNCSGQVNISFTNTGNITQVIPLSETGLYYGSVNPTGPNEITFDGVQLTNYQGYGSMEVEVEFVSSLGVTTTCKATITVLDCCQDWEPDVYLIGGALSDVFPQQTGVANQKIQVYGEVIVDQAFTFQSNNIFLAPDASLVLNDGIQLTMHENTLEPLCDYRWDRIYAAYPSNVVTFTNNQVRSGLRALHMENDAQLFMTENEMNSNRISLLVENCLQNTNPDFSPIEVYANIFQEIYTLANDPPQHPSSPVDIYNDYVVGGCQGSNPYWNTGVMFLNSSNVHLGDPTQQANRFLSPPSLAYRREGVRIRNSKVWVRNNEFAEDNFAVCGYAMSRMKLGGSLADENRFSIQPSASTLKVFNAGLEASWNVFNGGYVIIEDPAHVGYGGSLGIHFGPNDAFNSSLFFSGTTPSTSYVRIADNALENSLLVCDNLDLNTNGRLIVTGNTVERDDWSGQGEIRVLNCDGADVNLNVINSNVTGPTRPYRGMLSSGVTNSNFCSNTFSAPSSTRGFERALEVAGTQTGTQYSSNVFEDDHNYGLFWADPTNLSNQGSTVQGANNDWGSFSGANRWGEVCSICTTNVVYFYHAPPGNTAFNPFIPITNFSAQASGGPGSCTPIVIKGQSLDPKLQGVSVYPNPANDVVYFFGPTLSRIRIYNMMGQICGQAQGPVTNYIFSGFEPGVYVIEYAEENGKQGFIKVLKE